MSVILTETGEAEVQMSVTAALPGDGDFTVLLTLACLASQLEGWLS